MNEIETGMALLQGFAFFLGACVGSFLNVCIYRMPRDLSVVHPRSQCPSCGHPVRAYDNIPIVSWLVLRGRCRDCGARFGSLYPAIELLTGLVAWLLFRRIMPDATLVDPLHAGAFVLLFALAAALIAQAYIDLRYQIIPFELSIYLVPFVGGWALLEYAGYPGVGFRQSILGALFGGGALAGLSLFWRLVFRKEALGGGDVYLTMMIGAGLGLWPGLPYVLVAGSLIGLVFGFASVVSRRAFFGVFFPFGPSLALASLLFMVHGPVGAEAYVKRMSWLFGLEDPVLPPRTDAMR